MNPSVLCTICLTPLGNASQCICPNRVTVGSTGEIKSESKHYAKLDAEGITLTTDKPAVDYKSFTSLFAGTLVIVNATGQTIGKIKSSNVSLIQKNTCTLSYMDGFASPVPVLEISMKSIAVEIADIKKTDAILCDSYSALLLVKSGYTNVYTPDTTPASYVGDMTCRRLVHFT